MEEGGRGILAREDVHALLQHLESRSRAYIAFFAIGFVAGYPAAEAAIEWLLDSEGFVPEGVEVVILQPLEVILLQLRIAAQLGFGLLVLVMVLDLSWNGRSLVPRNAVVTLDNPGLGKAALVLISMLALGGVGLVYAHEVLIPFLLQYLSEDAAASGLKSTWQLQTWVGFVSGLYFSSFIGFQVPVVVVALLRTGIIERESVIENRGVLWFAALFIGALISPPDPISLFLVGGPMLVLLEMALIFDRAFGE